MNELPKIGAIAPWYGSNRMLAKNVAQALRGNGWVGIPFAGSMTEIQHITARTMMVNDLHNDLINLATIMSCPTEGPKLYRMLRRAIFHPDWLAEAQQRAGGQGFDMDDHLGQAAAYFESVWMGRSACAGTHAELRGGPAVRWNASGGDSAVRFQNAIASIPAWRRLMRRCTFTCLDWPEFLIKCKDERGIGIYCDPPFPGPGDKYKHTMTEHDHCKLAQDLTSFREARVVCRFYDVPLIRKLYPRDLGWEWIHLKGRDQANGSKPEVLITRNP